MDIFADITQIIYSPLLCRELKTFDFNKLGEALSKDATFILKLDDKNKMAVSWWVSAKRTRSYPYARVYDFLSFSGKKVTIIPIVKDEGKDGDRDFLQWDTVSLMNLLGVYVIIAYYKDAIQSSRYKNKITKQRFDIDFIKNELNKLLSYQSDALHWNLSQIDKISEIASSALLSYGIISRKLGVEMHSKKTADNRIQELMKGKKIFMSLSRHLAKKAQYREVGTRQPKENLKGIKAALTIKNYLGGYYYFTCDEMQIDSKNIYLFEAKHTKTDSFPSLNDIKDGLIKMILFINLKNVRLDGNVYKPIPVLKLTTNNSFAIENLSEPDKRTFKMLKQEAIQNNFKLLINDSFFI